MVLVTGGTGFLGSYIIKNLVEKGHKVRAIRRSTRLPFWIDPAIMNKVEWVDADILDTASIDQALQDVDGIVHAAAVVSFTKKGRKNMYSVNVEGTANLVNAAIEHQIKRIVHVSSIAALGRTTNAQLITEERKWEHNSNNTHYAISKHQAEMHVWRGFAEGLAGVIINPSTILGYGDWHQSSNTIFKNIYKGFSWYTKGVNGFVGVEDTAEAAVQLLFSDITEQRFIVNADNWVFKDLFQAIADGFGKKPPSREAGKALGELAWRLEAVKAFITRKKPLLTRETAKVGLSKTSFDGTAILRALPQFRYTPLEVVIKNACENYMEAVEKSLLSP